MGECNDILKSLDSYTTYKELDIPREVNNNDVACDDLRSNLRHYPKFSSYCYKLSRNIKDTLLKSAVSRTQDSCDYLNNWIYDDLIKNELYKNEENISDSEVIKKIPELWKVFEAIYVDCKFKVYDMSTTDFFNMKYLHDYSKNYKTLEGKISLTNSDCKEHYCSYVKSVMDLYNNVESNCSPTKSDHLCTIFNTIGEDKKPSVLSDKFGCSTKDLNAFIIQGDKFINKIAKVPGSENAAPGTGLKVGFSLIGILLLSFFLLYKYTPLGNSLRLLIRNKIGTKYSMDQEESHNFLENTWDSEDEKSQNNKLHVSYEPI
ncbi:PIR Superfamily Protein [Plasmodium ovale wallikeri]|uniref:PIR Superfamily Protein n=1 Tax=Plasmodium ovale wallikeri TaxID=864142 RepID=A0A1A9AF80_PLAOA|nr:PIR Superfamily Protein [Plasmodium ovale wallikeri]SBT58810.1 PIR Superfamily Protein [Plasmodium ovale wallikeri]